MHQSPNHAKENHIYSLTIYLGIKYITFELMSRTIDALYDFSVLRTLRKREGLTIKEVSQRSGISQAVISKLERNQSRAELDTLYKLSRVFGMNSADLLSLSENRTAQRLEAEAFTSAGFQFERVRYGNLVAYLGTAKAGTQHSNPEVHQDEYEICWVLKGSLTLVLPDETHHLMTGQSVQFDAILEHTYKVHEDCKVIIIHLRKDKRF